MKNWMKRIVSAAVVVSMSVALLAGCGKSQTSSTTADAAITMDEGSVSMDEAKLYAYVMKSQYEAHYGSEIWDMEIEEGTTFGDSMKEMITKELVQMVLLSSKADDYGVSLSDEDKFKLMKLLKNKEVFFHHNYWNKYKSDIKNFEDNPNKLREEIDNYHGLIDFDNKKHFSNILELGKQYVENIKKYGYPQWYDWCVEN